MIICKNCGVELEAGMEICPLCGQPVNGPDVTSGKSQAYSQALPYARQMTAPQKKFVWEIVSLILLSAIFATLIIDFIITKSITWSEYPAAISLTIFAYLSLFAFWRKRTFIQILAGLVLSSASMIIVDAITGGFDWALTLGIPMLAAANLVIVALVRIIQRSKHKGVNLLAWCFVGAAILCIFIEATLSYYHTKSLYLSWSVIVCGSIIPVVLVLLFVHFRLKKGRDLKRTFHI
jgi:hypothetical protein